ncbi:TetR/AcrR family transcriptional regulator [Acetivibrio ethanolgignens]|uniref:TetR family transcriptional regulator n=1 Tax=Acetivibrio ethanolgignens TaxID=290052 RepID=A0A0V8Q9Y5_9FIRM|nr:TetR/AcrR family transcriptional regulator [Acetivibrio ethanolgignens]KSV57419.1 TetR family transcriptional regulator [Acetivibrio ethanolgignens]
MARNKYPELTVEKILEVSQRLFLEKGYEQTTIQDIVDNLGGLTKGAVYHHFKSKEEIINALGDKMFLGNNPFNIVKDQDGLNGLQKIQKAMMLNQEDTERATLSRNTIPLLENPRILAGMIESQRKYLSPEFCKLIEEGIKDGSINTEYPKELSEVLPLLELWLMPSIFPASEEELHHKIMFIKELFEHMGVPLFDEQILSMIEEVY